MTAMYVAILLLAASVTIAPAVIWFTSTFKVKVKVRRRKKKERKKDLQWPPPI